MKKLYYDVADLEDVNLPAPFTGVEEINNYLEQALPELQDELLGDSVASLAFVSKEEIQDLNRTYRNKDYATNVLTFPFPTHEADENNEYFLGDIVVCTEVVEKEAQEQGKSYADHLTHIIIHSTLHLFGYDHIEEDEAQEMEDYERSILKYFGIKDPYIIGVAVDEN